MCCVLFVALKLTGMTTIKSGAIAISLFLLLVAVVIALLAVISD